MSKPEPPKVLILYGRGGVGKTTAIAALARKHDFGDLYFINADMDGIDAAYGADKQPLPGIHHSAKLQSVAELSKEWDRVTRRKDIPDEVQTLVFDSFSLIDLRIIDHVSDGGGPCETAKMDKQKWGQRNQMIISNVTKAYTLPYKYVIFVAHERVERDAQGNLSAIYPSVGSDTSRRLIEGAVSSIMHMQLIGRDKRRLTCNANSAIIAKCRAHSVTALLNDQGQTDKPLHEVLAGL